MFKRHFIIIALSISTIIGCGRFDNEYTSVVSSDEVSNIKVTCVNFLGVPTMCAVINQTTRTIRIESVVTNIVHRIVKKEVVTEVPVEQIVKRVETRYIVTGKEVDIEEIVEYVIARIKEHVPPDDIINVPIDVIVDETTDSIANAPPPENVTTLGDIRDEKPPPPPQEDKEETPDPNPDDGGTEEGTNGGGTEGSTPPENIDGPEGTDGSTEGSTPPENIDGPEGTDGGTEADRKPWTPPEGAPTVRMQVSIGPKKMDSPPTITQPGLRGSVTCQIEDTTVHPSLNSYSVFKGGRGNQWGVEFWCEVPADIDDSHTTIHVNVNDFERWCGLTTKDIKVSKFNENNDRSLRGIGRMNALIKLSPNPVPACRNAPVFTEGTDTTRSVAENTASGEPIGAPVEATGEDGDTLEYTLGGTDASAFSIDINSGQLRTSAPLDYETKDTYSVSVSANDGKLTNTIAVTINVTNVNEAPMFIDGFSTSRSVPENTAPDTVFGDAVEATDPDGDTLEYTIQTLVSGAFGIESTTGRLKTSAELDYETKSLYWGTVTVSDGNGGTDEITVQIGVTDANDPPMFDGTKTTRVILEDAASGTDIGDAVEATDPDNDTLEYSLSGTDASSFSIDINTGQLSTNTTLDYDTKSSYSVTVSVSDGNGGTDSIDVTIEVLLAYISKQEFFKVYYAINLDSGFADVQCYTIRGYGYDDGTPIYVDNYYKFEDGSPEQTSTGWGSTTVEGSIAKSLEVWEEDYPESFDYVHASTTVSVHDRTADEARGMIYQTICGAASNMGTWDSYQVGITYPNTANNTSNDVIDLDTILTYFEDDDCNPNN